MDEAFLQYDSVEGIQTQLRLANNWLTVCRKHKGCQQPYLSMYENTGKRLPTRLLHIGKNPYSLRLVLSDQIDEPEEINYVALSHCWGPDAEKIPRTTASNFESRLKGIQWSDLSLSFQDAVYVTMYFGYTYLWIDSLCIIQQSKEDFQHECALMHFVYSYASLVLAASGAVDGSIGMLGLRKSSKSGAEIDSDPPKQAYDGKRPALECFTTVKQEALAQRAWACQERELATRTLHFTHQGVVWECKGWVGGLKTLSLVYREAAFSGEGYNLPETRSLLNTPHVDLETRKRFMYLKWYSFIESYTEKKLSNETDRLPALEGIAIAMKKAIESCGPKEKYLFGLWGNDIMRGLLWKRAPRRRSQDQQYSDTRKEGIPTWSWASLSAASKYDFTRPFLDPHYNHNGEKQELIAEVKLTEAGELEALAPMVDTSLGRIFHPRKGYRLIQRHGGEYELLKDGTYSGVLIHFDIPFAEELLAHLDSSIKLMFFLRIPTSDVEDGNVFRSNFFLLNEEPVELAAIPSTAANQTGLILQAHSELNKYRRIGVFEIKRESITYGGDLHALVNDGTKVEWRKLILV